MDVGTTPRRSTSSLGAMESRTDTPFYTPLADCLRWALRLMVVVVLGTAVLTTVGRALNGCPMALTVKSALSMLLFAVVGGVALGLLLFFFGWLGRATVSSDGLKGPRYSGLHDFVSWSDVAGVEPGSLSGWPCIIVRRRSGKSPIYLMVVGQKKKDLARSVLSFAPPGNPLADYVEGQGT